ncbi:arylacetamide deacetylase-like 4 [Bufo bufo]|uniref:arylacetamide deacetylase-like 4 n=1 Tax=Bufo bufo TaxID=8384 RepID=UPI001ABE7A8D|nr:arylacetamide deacetylase-like 4 [Bufo bufo]
MLGVVALLGVITLFLVFCLLIFSVVTWYESSKAEIPPGIANPSLLRNFHILSTGAFILGGILDKLGVLNIVQLFRFLQNVSKPKLKDDPMVFKKDLQFHGVPVRIYQPRDPSVRGRKGVMFFHGGGFTYGSIDSYDLFCTYLTKNSGAVVISVGYRLAPEHRCPAALEDCLLATVHFLKTAQEHGVDPSSVIICGDSAGGNLAAGVCQALVGRSDIPKPLAQVLIYPLVQRADFNLPSYQQNKMVPLLLRDFSLYNLMMYIGGDLSLSKDILKGSHVPPEIRQKISKWLSSEEFKVKGYKPYIMAPFNKDVYEKVKKAVDLTCSPLFSDDNVIRQLPKAYILTCEFDILRDDGLLYKKRLEDNGVTVTWHHVKDGFHGVVGFFHQPEVVCARLAVDNVINYIKNL